MPASLLVANWKMNAPPAGFDAPDSPYRSVDGVEVVVLPTALHLAACVAAGLLTGVQGARSEPSGAFTGDISLTLAKAAGASYAVCGHSERRRYHAEDDAQVAAQVAAALELGLIPIVCIGENDGEERGAVLDRQLGQLPKDDSLIIAYEPVWAIGTGKAATPTDALDAAAAIRESGFTSHRILYGGSANEENAAAFLKTGEVTGFLVGGASLKPASFSAMRTIASGK